MFVIAVLLLVGTGLTANRETHSLHYIYTGLSKPVGLPGIHEFTAMGLLDDRMIDYFDSEHQAKVPRQEWMREHLPADYWEIGTWSRKSKQQWFKISINILMERMRQNDSASPHVLQWMLGCEGETQPDGTLRFVRGMNMYAYDGEDFLSFDDKNGVWVAPIKEALPTKMKWDSFQVLKEYTKGYLEYECIDWLSKFVYYGQQQLKKKSPPEVYMFAKKAKVETNLILTCLATGFYPKDIIMRIRRNGRVLTANDSVRSSGVLPNNDETFQRRDHVEILKSDLSEFSCEIVHEATGVNVMMPRRISDLPPEPGLGALIAVAVGAVLAVVPLVAVAVGLILYKMGVIGGGRGANNNQDLPLVVYTTTQPQPSLFPTPGCDADDDKEADEDKPFAEHSDQDSDSGTDTDYDKEADEDKPVRGSNMSIDQDRDYDSSDSGVSD